ncbi:phospholipase/Carboxylesterase family protein [Candidatus Endolissoclinum faulkneri L2]|uniref:Phospholipase/Carboxylesterase family protein n=1 Tax=Candidatus Endolissoclinum faulkneri L2 TaxID=1193729 RepID=K7Z4N7_9PROT|nr:alpha/beta fold hydrolase [Candidatus Endolissoclinum faulkneri]AFX98958.1 phospholipase/Carboxylesterase family protein [Candidatus Endolissoclinum faulkneri L2]
MTQIKQIYGPRLEPSSGKKAEALVVMLHGLGADGNDLIEVARIWAPQMASVAFVAPHAPFPCDMTPSGRQWFDFMHDGDYTNMHASMRSTAEMLNEFLNTELDRLSITANKLALVGFSQGTMIALYAALRRLPPIAGIVGYSGALIVEDIPEDPITSKPQVLLIHGTLDNIVPFSAMEAAQSCLISAGIAVTSISRPGLGHSIDEDGLKSGGAFLSKVLVT